MRNIVTELGDNLGIAIANMVNLFNPSIVVFDKRLELAGEALSNRSAVSFARSPLLAPRKT